MSVMGTARVLMRRLAAVALGVMVPRPMQQEAYDRLASARLRRLHSPTGSGKTLLIQIIAMTEMLSEGRRTLIAVPQRNIGRGFRARRVWLPRRGWTVPAFLAAAAACVGLSLWHWWCLLVLPPLWLLWRRLATRRWAAVNKCESTRNSVNEVEAFIRGGRGIMVCCHAFLARAWRRVGNAEDIEGLSLWIDEAHYVKAGEERNGVGEMVHALVRGDESVRVGLATATPCRGDRRDIVHPDDAGDFVSYDGPFDRHFEENMPSVESVKFDYVPYSPAAGWDGALTEWLSGRGQTARRTLFYIPHPISALSSPDSSGKPGKIADLERVLAAIEKIDPGADVVDLVTDNGDADRERRMRALEARIAAGDDPDYVVALNLMKVGSDWPNLRNVVDLAPSVSLPDSGQKFGRLAREPSRGTDKSTITYASFFPTLGQDAGEGLRRACSERLTSLISLLLLHYAAEGAPLFRRRPGSRDRGEGNPAMAEPWLEEFLATLATREGGAEHATCVEVARALMDEMGIPEGFRSGLEHIVRHLNRRPSDRTAAALVDAGFDIVGYGELGAMTVLTTGDHKGSKLFERFRAAERGLEPLLEETILGWMRLHRDRTGKPPSCHSGDAPSPGETWKAIDTALRRGFRSLPGGSSLHDLSVRLGWSHRIQDLNEEQIMEWMRAHKRRTGREPTRKDTVFETGDTWCAIEQALSRGCRGLPGGSGLAALRAKLGWAAKKPNLSEDTIVEWAAEEKRRTGKCPSVKTGEVSEAPGETWETLDFHLKKGGRGLPGGSSLSRLLQSRGLRKRRRLDKDTVAAWCAEHLERTGKLPAEEDGEIPGTSGETWCALACALRRGQRGLPAGTLRDLQIEYGLRPPTVRLVGDERRATAKCPTDLDREIIVGWMRAHVERTGNVPTQRSGKVHENPSLTWCQVYDLLRRGGGSLTELAEDAGLIRGADLKLTEREITEWLLVHENRHGKAPVRRENVPGVLYRPRNRVNAVPLKWQAVDRALQDGRYGLPGGSSMFELWKNRKNQP